MKRSPDEFKRFRTALIDGDILIWAIAFSADRHQMDRLDIAERVVADVQDWTRRAFCTDFIVTTTESRSQNFRRQFYPEYKKHRDEKEKPSEIEFVYEQFNEHYNVFSRPILEADDCMGLLATVGKINNPVIVSIDKDMRTVPGWHFNPHKEDFPVYVDYETAEYNFHMQWLIGDKSDNYPGIYRVGEKKAAKILGNNLYDYTARALQAYKNAGMTYADALLNARCARILTSDLWDAETKQPILWTPSASDLEGLEEWAEAEAAVA
jgi:DNA polymerase-1